MPTIAIRLDPARLENADTDLRYLVPDLVVAAAGGTVSDDGYDYDPDGRLLLFLQADDLTGARAAVMEVLTDERPLGNDLAPAAVVAVADEDRCSDPTRFRVVHPPDGEMFALP